uniref:XLR/SYCP3/FAM9 domain-containing protein n=1 Tax=Sus scrofa TaxID=9823 RepID=A0A8D1G4X6_PIG
MMVLIVMFYRQNLHLEYSQQFQTLFREWDIDIQKAQEQEEKLANMFQEQRKSLQQARIVQNQRLKKIQNLYEQFLKSMEELEKDHDRLLTDEQNEVRQEMAKLQDKIMVETVSSVYLVLRMLREFPSWRSG